MNKLDFIRPRKPNVTSAMGLLSSKPEKHKFRFIRLWASEHQGTAVRDGEGWYVAKPVEEKAPKKYNWVFKRGKLRAVAIGKKKDEKRTVNGAYPGVKNGK